MTEDQMTKFLRSTLHLDNPGLKDAVIQHIISRGYKEEYRGWEQLRFIKHEVDKLWGTIKKCSEREIVRERVGQMMSSFPKPTK